MKRTISYEWHLAELMARNGMHNSTDLAPHLLERGVDLSPAQIWRLVTQKPERLSIPILAALCDVFHCTAAELITTHAENAAPAARVANGGPPPVPPQSRARPRRPRHGRAAADERR